jgi:hypothetical protein
MSLVVLAGFALCNLADVHPSDAANMSSMMVAQELHEHIILTSSADVLPSQRPCYLLSQSGQTASRFTRPGSSGKNPWGLAAAPTGTGLVTMKPGETCGTAGNVDLGSATASATAE